MKPQLDEQALSDLVSRVHHANRIAHDCAAAKHDRAVAYISRPQTAAYLWGIIRSACEDRGRSFAGARVLEIGCGTGTFAARAIEAGAASYHGIDVSPKMLELARSKFNDPRITFEESPLEAFAASAGRSFDIILSSSLLHHLVDLSGGIALIRGMLHKGGVYVAVHEVVHPRRVTLIEQLDSTIQYFAGYGTSDIALWKRPFKVLGGHAWRDSVGGTRPLVYRLKCAVKSVLQWAGLRQRRAVGDQSDYVDYQLNRPFRLSQSGLQDVEVLPYCYLGIVELMKIRKPMNHEMLVATSDAR